MTIEPKLMSARRLAKLRWQFDGCPGDHQELLAHIAAQDKRIVDLKTLSDAAARAVEVMDDIGEQARAKIADLELRLQVATDANVADRKRMAELDGILGKVRDAVG